MAATQGFTYGIPPNFFIEAARGIIPEARIIRFGGNSSTIGASSKLLWSGDVAFPRQSTNSTLSVVSTSVNDTSAGTGARTVLLFGIKVDGTQTFEIISMNGTTPVISVNTYAEPIFFLVLSGGAGQQNMGNITATKTDNAQLWGKINIGEGQCKYGFIVIPAERMAFVEGFQLNSAGLASVEFDIYVQGISGTTPTPPLLAFRERLQGGDTTWIDLRHGPFIGNALSRISVHARNPVNNNTMFASVEASALFTPSNFLVAGNVPV